MQQWHANHYIGIRYIDPDLRDIPLERCVRTESVLQALTHDPMQPKRQFSRLLNIILPLTNASILGSPILHVSRLQNFTIYV